MHDKHNKHVKLTFLLKNQMWIKKGKVWIGRER